MLDMYKLGEIGGHDALLEPNKSALVALLVAVVRGTENSDGFAIVLDLIALLLHLMGPDQQRQVVVLQKSLGDILPKAHTDAPLTRGPAWLVTRVSPQQVTHDACVGGLP